MSKVNVLGVLDDMASTVQLVSEEHKAWHARIVNARAAVAELIEAVREYRAELRKTIGCGTYDQVVARVDAALANIGSTK